MKLKSAKWSRQRRKQHGITYPVKAQQCYTVRSKIIRLYYRYGCQHKYGPIYSGTTNAIIADRLVKGLNWIDRQNFDNAAGDFE